ncbi:lantibiotic dehydratase [Micromonospora echinofusca]|uniref:Lantibiotic dehydratase n=1 Tax=Micromonospora echinofusca TaxID=47858 RepID=A0ABS3VQM7_MICEH|nr:lantibiotic dehydratase [Micromonospora echinofusca]MBO4206788.1 lantibiotic dehydratase [Micromonospora echinofusca]
MNHRFPLGDTGWSVWRDAGLRTAGFPVAGLDLFAAPDAAVAADALLAAGPRGDRELTDAFDKALEAALADGTRAANAVAADPLLREAVTWQNRSALVALDGLLATAGSPSRGWRRRDREKSLVQYWQRYCGKSETIGYFGPVCWATVAESSTRTEVRPGPGLVRLRRVFFEAWALMAYAEALGADLAVRRWWAPVRPPHLTVAGRRLHRPLRAPVELTPVDAWLLARCDGRTSAADLVGQLRAEPEFGVRSDADGFLLLDRLVERELLTWDAALPNNPDAEAVLRERVAAIGDPTDRAKVQESLDRLCARRDAVAAAAGDPDALRVALDALDAEFTAVTGAEASRRGGQMYAGRTLVYEETTRDVDLVVGSAVLDALAAPLAVVLRAARWLTAEFGAVCERVLTDLYDELAADGPLPLADIWSLAQGLLFEASGPTSTVAAEFTARWSKLFGLDTLDPGQAELRLDSADLADRAAALFDAAHPGWPSARMHSPDIQICATDVEAINRGEFLLVLGELHPAYIPFDCAVFSRFHPDPARLRADLDADLGPARIRVLYPEGFPRQTTRTGHGLTGPADRQLGIDTARGAELDRLVPATAVRVEKVDGKLVAVLPDGARWPLVEVFANLLGALLLDSFKLMAPAAHTPRITIDRLVVSRRSWRTTVGETGLTEVTGDRDRYLAVRRWRDRLGLPERMFVKVGTETKPCYVDLTGPLYAQALCTMLRNAARHGGDVGVVVTELLPDTTEAWLPDAAGRGYVSELRLQITDEATYPTSGDLS